MKQALLRSNLSEIASQTGMVRGLKRPQDLTIIPRVLCLRKYLIRQMKSKLLHIMVEWIISLNKQQLSGYAFMILLIWHL